MGIKLLSISDYKSGVMVLNVCLNRGKCSKPTIITKCGAGLFKDVCVCVSAHACTYIVCAHTPVGALS